MKALSVILPIHNEQNIIEKVTSEICIVLKKMSIRYEVFLVENGSSDNSLFVIKSISQKNNNIKVLVSEKGYGSAIIAGVRKAKGKYICYMPSDGQVDLSVLPLLWNLAQKDMWKIVKVKRITRENLGRLLVSKGFSLILKLFFNTPFIDVNGSPRILKTSDLIKLKLTSDDSFIDAESLIKMSYLNWKIKEIPMKNVDRYGGTSTRSINTYIEFFRNIIHYKKCRELSLWKDQQK